MKAVFFDLDGTLLDTLEDLCISVNFTLQKMDLPKRSTKEIRSFLGNGVVNLMKKSLPDYAKDRLEEALPIFREHYGKHSEDHTQPYPGIPQLLERLQKEGYVTAIISNKPDFAVQTLTRTYFPTVSFSVGEREGIRRKPHPDSILEAMRLLKVEKENCLYVGDSEVDVQTAKNLGMACVALTWGFRDREDLLEAGAEHLADTAQELYEKIEELI